MKQCETCGAPYYVGTLFCKECGRSLEAARGLEQPARYLHVLIGGGRQPRRLDLSQTICIGRSDPESGHWPDLDLSDHAGIELGVSRRHALIMPGDGGPVLVDQHSANGTWIEQERLQPDRPYPLPPVATLRFGRCPVRVVLE